MSNVFSFTTDTATLAIFDLQAIQHRKSDTADWWSILDDEIGEMNKGNIAFIGLGCDGFYTINLCDNIEEADVKINISCPSGRLFIGAGEDTTGGDLEPDAPEYRSGEVIFLPTGNYEISVKKKDDNLLIAFNKSKIGINLFKSTLRI
ncbi:hypothetical protein I5F07_02745 [Proteus vulgaris]|jgi:hypothetical protein|uniref:Uncharacterized protein n=1 Tax=Proteus vulgaris TaxID=585 RepID=A0A379FCN1_PROVU|nr:MULTISPECIES: DUF6386 family protein [Proteus]NBN60405.1 hypothetical protein [Proteus sp. G2639]RNT28725.1 hypothetical protein B9475_005590 [Proteus mirabilis]AYY81044.1 hypothetical protein EGX81_09175 [Proteus vulgaris]KGA59911.1 hypothetical protein DR95_425 [Proteus vulgaris]MBG5972415.1 hypothetical protein [Proteus vulgaris]